SPKSCQRPCGYTTRSAGADGAATIGGACVTTGAGAGVITTGLGVDLSTSLLLYTQPPSVARSTGAINTARTTRMFMSLLHACSWRLSPAGQCGHLLCHAVFRRTTVSRRRDCVDLDEAPRVSCGRRA